MTAAERLKGRRAEAEVARLLRDAGFAVRGLESGGDHHAVRGGLRLHVEVKRQERGWRWAWAAQAVADAPDGSVPVVVFRRSCEPWQVARRVGFRELPQAMRGPASGTVYSSEPSGGQMWAFTTLAECLEALGVPA